MYSDFLYLQDYTNDIGKTHTIPVELNDSNKLIEFPDGTKRDNYGIRELNLRMQQSGFSPTKFVLIENIQRMSGSAMNAFLKTSEEPLKNRFIIATLPHTSQVLDTILSRSIAIHFDPLSEKEMEEFAQEKSIVSSDKELQKMLIVMAMGKPGMLLRLSEQISLNPDLATTIKSLITTLATPSASQTKKQQLLKQLAEIGLLQDFIDGRIAYGTEHNLFSYAEKWLEIKRLMQANVNVDNVLWYGVLE
jgi:DNA polymerase III delta prime subunit